MSIAYDSQSSGSSTVGALSVTVAHTVTGSHSILILGAWDQDGASNTVTGITYNSNAMTKYVNHPNANQMTLWYIFIDSPDGASHNIVATRTGSNNRLRIAATSYNGVFQSTFPDAHNETRSLAATSHTTSVTTVINNAWTVLVGGNDNGVAMSAGASTTKRTTAGTEVEMFDSNAAKTPAGSTSLTITTVGTQNLFSLMVSIAPFGFNISVNDTAATSEVLAANVGVVGSYSDTQVTTEALDTDYALGPGSKSTTTWTNLPKS